MGAAPFGHTEDTPKLARAPTPTLADALGHYRPVVLAPRSRLSPMRVPPFASGRTKNRA